MCLGRRAGLLLSVQGVPKRTRKLGRLALSPEVHKEVRGRFADHVIMQGDDVQSALAKGMKHRLNFRRGDAVDYWDGEQ